MACRCSNFVKAQSISVETTTGGDSYIQITVPSTTTFTEGDWCIGLFTTIPTSVNCANVTVTNGTDTYPILRCNGNNWRPAQLRCRSVLNCQFLTDPDHFLIVRR